MNLKLKLACSIFVPAVLALFAGCEVESADSDIYITPDSTVLQKHQSVVLSAHGGYRYEWSLETEEWGVMNTRGGSEVVYTSIYEPSGDVSAVQVVNVSSVFYTSDSTGVSGTNGTTTSYVSTAEAYITHLPAGE